MLVERFQIMWPDGSASDLQVRRSAVAMHRYKLEQTHEYGQVHDKPGYGILNVRSVSLTS